MNFGTTISTKSRETGTVPDYTFNSWDVGPQLGLALYPYECSLFRLGLFAEGFRGSKIYKDVYTKGADFGNHSYMKLGISIHPFSRRARQIK